MSTSSQELLKSFDLLPDPEKREVASEIIRRTFALSHKVECDEAKLASIYAEFVDDDRVLAEEGIEDYQKDLLSEDAG